VADQRALKFVGIAYGGVAMVVTLMALLMVLRDVETGAAQSLAYGVAEAGVQDAAAPRAAIASVQ